MSLICEHCAVVEFDQSGDSSTPIVSVYDKSGLLNSLFYSLIVFEVGYRSTIHRRIFQLSQVRVGMFYSCKCI